MHPDLINLVCRQGLQDLAHFITAMNTKYSFTSKAYVPIIPKL